MRRKQHPFARIKRTVIPDSWFKAVPEIGNSASLWRKIKTEANRQGLNRHHTSELRTLALTIKSTQ